MDKISLKNLRTMKEPARTLFRHMERSPSVEKEVNQYVELLDRLYARIRRHQVKSHGMPAKRRLQQTLET